MATDADRIATQAARIAELEQAIEASASLRADLESAHKITDDVHTALWKADADLAERDKKIEEQRELFFKVLRERPVAPRPNDQAANLYKNLLEQTEAELAEVTEALRPFANALDECGWLNVTKPCAVEMDHFLRARAVLAKPEQAASEKAAFLDRDETTDAATALVEELLHQMPFYIMDDTRRVWIEIAGRHLANNRARSAIATTAPKDAVS